VITFSEKDIQYIFDRSNIHDFAKSSYERSLYPKCHYCTFVSRLKAIGSIFVLNIIIICFQFNPADLNIIKILNIEDILLYIINILDLVEHCEYSSHGDRCRSRHSMYSFLERQATAYSLRLHNTNQVNKINPTVHLHSYL